MIKKLLVGVALTSIAASGASAKDRQLDVIGLVQETDVVPSIGAPFGIAPVVGIFWDERCASVDYVFNSAQPANPGGAEIAPEVLAETVQRGLDRWNENPASYIEMNITEVRDLGNRPRTGGDFINEVTFITPAGFTALASSPSTALLADSTFNPGDDLNGDGNPDVFDPAVEGRNTCFDADGDGDIEFPAGDYKAGTILDNDVQFGSAVVWELDATINGGADVDAVSTHEFGHSHGLNHALTNQISAEDGTGSTMYPFIDTGDPASELGSRSLHTDDLAASAFIYPEGTGTMIGAIQSGDIPFTQAYDVLRGSITAGDTGLPNVGTGVFIENRKGVRLTQTYGGEVVVYQDVFDVNGNGNTGELFVFEEGIVDGDFELPVPASDVYTVMIEALDGDPVAASRVSVTAQVGSILGQALFPEEGFDPVREDELEFQPDLATPFYSRGYLSQRVDLVTNLEDTLRNAGDVDFIGSGAIALAQTVTYAERFDRSDILARIAQGDRPIAGLFQTGVLDASDVSELTDARLMTGRVQPDGTVDLVKTLAKDQKFLGQDGELTPFVLQDPWGLPYTIRRELTADDSLDLFLVLSGDNLTIKPNGFPPAFVALDGDLPNGGTSFLSVDGGPLGPQLSGTWSIEMRFINDGSPVPAYLASAND